MDAWKRAFGLHPVDMILHGLVGMFIVIGIAELAADDAFAILGTAGIFASYAWRRHRAIAALPAAGSITGEVKAAELEAQAEEIHELRDRLMELEERLDFTERMLAKSREPEQLPRNV